MKKRNEVENLVEKSKNEPVKNESEGRIVTFPVKTKMPDFIEIDSSINNDGKKTFYLTGISLEYVNNFDNTKYEIDDLKVNPKNNDVYDITYHNK
jgi:hypothetical protein